MFTGDRSGDWLYKTLYKFGFSNQPESISKDDGLKLNNCYITAVVRCAPPENKPTSQEIKNCNDYLKNELMLLKNVKVIVTLGQISFATTIKTLIDIGFERINGNSKFYHGNELTFQRDKKKNNPTLFISPKPKEYFHRKIDRKNV